MCWRDEFVVVGVMLFLLYMFLCRGYYGNMGKMMVLIGLWFYCILIVDLVLIYDFNVGVLMDSF